MSYASYVAAAYAIFIVFIAWDFIAPRLLLARARSAARQRARRDAARAKGATP